MRVRVGCPNQSRRGSFVFVYRSYIVLFNQGERHCGVLVFGTGEKSFQAGGPDGRQTKYPWAAYSINFSAGLYFMFVY